MVINKHAIQREPHVKFVSYTGTCPNLCSGVLTLEINNEKVAFGYGTLYRPFWSSGGGITADYDIRSGEWVIDAESIHPAYRQYADEIDRVFNENVPHGCCGGCI